MLEIKLYKREGGKIDKVIVPSLKNQYKCNIWTPFQVLRDQITTGVSPSSNQIETLIESKEDYDTVVKALKELWKSPVETLEFHENVPGSFFKSEDQVHLVLRREGRNLYCLTLEGKLKFKIPNKEYVFEYPTWEEVRYFWENVNTYL